MKGREKPINLSLSLVSVAWPRGRVPSSSKPPPTPHSSTEVIRMQTTTAQICAYSTHPRTSSRSFLQTRHPMLYCHILGNKTTSPTLYHKLTMNRGEEEVLFSDICSGSRMLKKGWKKIRGCCRLAASHGHRHVWIDTVCIDKTSSAELSEAINSMYRYYEDAILCYVYLDIDIEGSNPTREELRSSRWMYRGW